MTHLFQNAVQSRQMRRACRGLIALWLSAWSLDNHAQELNCTVTVIAPQISNVDASRFDALEDAIREFMNGRRWTEDNFEFEEALSVHFNSQSTKRLGRRSSKEACKCRVLVLFSIQITIRQ